MWRIKEQSTEDQITPNPIVSRFSNSKLAVKERQVILMKSLKKFQVFWLLKNMKNICLCIEMHVTLIQKSMKKEILLKDCSAYLCRECSFLSNYFHVMFVLTLKIMKTMRNMNLLKASCLNKTHIVFWFKLTPDTFLLFKIPNCKFYQITLITFTNLPLIAVKIVIISCQIMINTFQ